MPALQEWLVTAYHGDDSPAAEGRIRTIEAQIGLRLPDPVRFVLTTAYPPEGFIGESYIAFFTVDDLAQGWLDAQRTAPGFVPFASNGAGEWYGLDSRVNPPAFVVMPSIGMEWATAMLLGATWEDFWEALKCGKLFDHVNQPRQQ